MTAHNHCPVVVHNRSGWFRRKRHWIRCWTCDAQFGPYPTWREAHYALARMIRDQNR